MTKSQSHLQFNRIIILVFLTMIFFSNTALCGHFDGYLEGGQFEGGETLANVETTSCRDNLCSSSSVQIKSGAGAEIGAGVIYLLNNSPLEYRLLYGEIEDYILDDNSHRVYFRRRHWDIAALYRIADSFKFGIGLQQYRNIVLDLTDANGDRFDFDRGKGQFVEVTYMPNYPKGNFTFMLTLRLGKASYTFKSANQAYTFSGVSNGILLGIEW